MPKITPGGETTLATNEVDRFTLEAGTTGRLVILDPELTWIPRHWIKGDDGKGHPYACIGDPDTVWQDGKDPARCPACVVGKAGDSSPVRKAEVRFICNIAAYRTDKSGNPDRRLSLIPQVWDFTPRTYNSICRKAQEHGSHYGKDIVVSAENRGRFTTLEVDISSRARFAEDESGDGKQQIRELDELKYDDEKLEQILATPASVSDLLRLIVDAGETFTQADAQRHGFVIDDMDAPAERKETAQAGSNAPW